MDTSIKRRFTGKLDGFESKEEKRFCKKQLTAYLKGWTHFKYGEDKVNGGKIEHKTPQVYEKNN